MQEDSVLQLKQELLRSSMTREELEGHNVSLTTTLIKIKIIIIVIAFFFLPCIRYIKVRLQSFALFCSLGGTGKEVERTEQIAE